MPGDFHASTVENGCGKSQEPTPMFFLLNGQQVEGHSGQTLLEAITPHYKLPSLCGEKIPGLKGPCPSCGLSVVEIKGRAELVQACSTLLEEGLEIRTFSQEVRRSRILALKELVNRHKGDCLICDRSGLCHLQEICAEQGLALLSQPRPNPEFTLVPAKGISEKLEAPPLPPLANLSLVNLSKPLTVPPKPIRYQSL
jgi:predicted molibdopterin-dependent oxidoreductase YjgC